MIETWKDAFTIVGGFVATAATVVTIQRGQSVRREINISPEEKAALTDSICKLLQYYNDLKIDVMGLKKDNEHMREKLDAMADHAERDHREVKRLTMILYPLIKNEISEQRKKMDLSGSDTETGEI